MRNFLGGHILGVPLLLIFLVSCAPSYDRGGYSAYPPVGTPAPLGDVTETDLAPIDPFYSYDPIEVLDDVPSDGSATTTATDPAAGSTDAFIGSLSETLSDDTALSGDAATSDASTATASSSPSGDFLSDAEIASVSGPELTHKSIVGAWTVTISDTNCQVFLALTRWSGGYRAASRGCRVNVMSDVQAWDVRDNRIILVGSDGNRSAILGRSGPERFEGKTSGGDDVMFTR